MINKRTIIIISSEAIKFKSSTVNNSNSGWRRSSLNKFKRLHSCYLHMFKIAYVYGTDLPILSPLKFILLLLKVSVNFRYFCKFDEFFNKLSKSLKLFQVCLKKGWEWNFENMKKCFVNDSKPKPNKRFQHEEKETWPQFWSR